MGAIDGKQGDHTSMAGGTYHNWTACRKMWFNKRLLQALALMAQPSHLPTALSELSSLSDEIWFLSGDTSVDTSWYTKRASLSAIYAATELVMTTDKSPNFHDTREFLDRRFMDVQIVGGTMGSMAQWAGFTGRAGLNILRSKGVRI